MDKKYFTNAFTILLSFCNGYGRIFGERRIAGLTASAVSEYIGNESLAAKRASRTLFFTEEVSTPRLLKLFNRSRLRWMLTTWV